MKKILPFILLAVLALGCKQGSSEPTTSTNGAPTTTTASPAAPAKAETKDISGSYDATGTNQDGSSYKSGLKVTTRGDVYQFSWSSGGNTYDGVGVQTGSNVGVAFTDGADGKGCGVVLYKIGADGTLDGKVGYWGENSSAAEVATRKSGSGVEGDYAITGKNPDGSSYNGTLAVKKNGSGFDFAWQAGTSTNGFGIQQGQTVAVGIGGKQCSFVSYEVKPDGTLDGKWGDVGTTSVGTEVAKKQ